ncbi:GldG family protein [Faecalispora anaeroviscerum]|uniref:GldG family protein n=1 Tax=Faecalispora anaeroviscerum TaxID=2991836 RepID=UPI0024B8CC74|nr:GldG family protein [Faecalispora anaeroviscerum]
MSEEKKTPQDAEETIEHKDRTPAEEMQSTVPQAETEPEQTAQATAEEESTEEATAAGEIGEDEAELEELLPEEAKQKKNKQNTFGKVLSSQKMRRRGISTVFTAVFLAVIILLNVIVSMLSTRFPSINLDLSAQKTNSLTEDSIKVVDAVKLPTTITILGSEADVRDNVLYSGYGFEYSQVAILSDKIKERNSNITVKYVDLDKNPTYASELGESNLTAGCVVVSTEKRHRVLQITDLFSQQTDYTTGSATSYSMVGTALASAISQVNSEKLPVIAFATGHEEIYDSTALQGVLKNASFETVSFNILTDAIPANAQMVMLASPATDYTPQELKKLDTFLENNKLTADRSLLITFYPSQEALPNLSAFLKEWGIEVPRSMVVERDQSHIAESDASFILTQTNVDSTVTLNSESTQYDNVVMPQASPVNLLFTSRDGVTTHSLAQSYDTTYLVDSSSTQDTVKNAKQQAYTTVALAQKNLSLDGTIYKQNVIVAGSSPMFADGVINASAYGNGKYVTDLIRYATGETDSNTGILVTPVQTNQVDINLSQSASVILGFGVFTILIPLCVLAAGFVVFLKRRHL